MIFIATAINDEYHYSLFNTPLEEAIESLCLRVNLPAPDVRTFLVGYSLSTLEGNGLFGERVASGVASWDEFHNNYTGREGLLVDDRGIVVYSGGKATPLHSFKTAEELKRLEKETLKKKFEQTHNIIKNAEDFKEYKKYLEIAEEYYDEVNVAEIEEFQEPFAVVCHESTETDFDGWDVSILSIDLIRRSEFE